MDLLTGITSILGGGITGLLGSVTQRIFEYKTKKLELEANRDKYLNEQKLRELDANILKEEWAARTKVADIEATAKTEEADSRAFSAAITSEPQKYHEGSLTSKQNWLMVILDFIRGGIRPCLTLYLCGITTVIYIQASKLLHGDTILPGMAYDLVQQIIQTILYLTTTCVLFWFGTRNKSKQK